jgi:hypothetical protein
MTREDEVQHHLKRNGVMAIDPQVATWKPGSWAVDLAALPPTDALREIAREAEHCSFCAAAFEPDEKALQFLGLAMIRLKELAKLALAEQVSA